MNRIFGLSRNAVALVGIVIAIILVVLVGMIVIGSAAIQALMVPGLKVEGISLLALLVTIIVLLSAIFIILLVLFWCCCKKQGKPGKEGELSPDMLAALLPVLPILPQLPLLLGNVGVAIYEAGKTLEWVQRNIERAASDLTVAATNTLAATPKVWAPGTLRDQNGDPRLDPNGHTMLDLNPLNAVQVNPLENAIATLRALSTNLVPAINAPNGIGIPVTFVSAPAEVTVAVVSATMVETGKALARVAHRLDHNAPIPAELLP